MKAREYCEQLQRQETIIRNKLEELKAFKEKSMTPATTYIGFDKTSKGFVGDKIGDMIAGFVDFEENINGDIQRLLKLRYEVIKTFEMLPCVQYDLLYKRYAQGMDIESIADALTKSRSWVTMTQAKALETLQVILDEREMQNE